MLSELFPREQVTIVSGDGSEFSSLPFAHLAFTGSTDVGRAVMKEASENLVPRDAGTGQLVRRVEPLADLLALDTSTPDG